jgi:hypothetical protein
MISEDFALMKNRLAEESLDASPRHFDNRTLRLERGLYVIRERTTCNATSTLAHKSEYLAEICGD